MFPNPRVAGLAGMVAGGASALTVVGAETPVEFITSGLYMPALVLILTFRIWAGARLWREGRA